MDEEKKLESKTDKKEAVLEPASAPSEKKAGAGGHHAPPKKVDQIYLVYAISACLFFACSGVIRKF